MISDHFPTLGRIWQRVGGAPRRVVAAVLAAAGVLLLLFPQHQGIGSEQSVVVATRPVSAGVVVRAADVRVAHWPSALVARSAIRDLADVVGRSLATSIDAGDVLTGNTLLGTAMSAGLQRGESAITVSLLGRAQLAVVHAGARIDLYASAGPGGASPPSASALPAPAAPPAPAAVASDVEVLAVLDVQPSAAGDLVSQSANIVVGCDRGTAARIAAAGPEFTAALRS